MKKAFIILAAVLFSSVQLSILQAQQQSNYIGINVGGGLGMPCYSTVHGDGSLGLGFGAGLHYAHFFGEHFGLGFGVNYSRLTGAVTYDFAETTQGLVHASNPGVSYDLTTAYDGWRERQVLGVLGVPVELFWRVPVSERNAVLFGLGAQLELPLQGRGIADEGTYATRGYFPSIGHTVENLPQHGFGSYGADTEVDIDNLRPAVSLLADLGFRFALGQQWGLYTGLYASYGLTSSIAAPAADPLLVLSPSDAGEAVYNGTFASSEVEGVHLLRVGIKVGIDFGWHCRQREVAEVSPVLVPTEAPQQEVADREAAERKAAEQAAAERKAAEERAAARAREEAAERERVARERMLVEQHREQARVELQRRVEGMVIVFDFAGSEPHIRTEDDLALRALCVAMQADESIKVLVTGHTDNIGSADRNLQLGMERAEAVRQRMVQHGAPAARIRTASRGEEQPVDTNATAEGRARNRRVELTIER